MTMRIKGTNEVVRLDVYDASTGVNWTHDFLGNAGAFNDGSIKYNDAEEIWIINPDAFAWWTRYIEDYESDEAAIHEFLSALYDLYEYDIACVIEEEFYNAIAENSEDYNTHHDVKQGALEWFFDCYIAKVA